MKLKLITTTMVSALALSVASAGSQWCAPSHNDKCPVDCCPDIGGQVSVGYDTDYVFKGIRLARDVVWGDVNYTFGNLPFSPNIGIWHLTDLSTGSGPGGASYGDETNLYAGIDLPSILGFDQTLGYTYFLFPTSRFPAGSVGLNGGDSLSQVTYGASRELFGGIRFAYTLDYLFGATAGTNPFGGADNSVGGFMHTLSLAKSFCITDCISLDLNGGVYYNDNYYSQGVNARNGNNPAGGGGFAGGPNDSGWHAYFIEAALPIALNCRATLRPYVRYNGTPDAWTGDAASPFNYFGFNNGPGPGGIGGAIPNGNANDVLSGGVSVTVDF